MWNPDQRMRLAGVIRERWWQGARPPEAAPGGWGLSRDLDICRTLIERESYDPDILADALERYDGPPATLAVFMKRDERGLRKILSELLGRATKGARVRPSSYRTDEGLDDAEVDMGALLASVGLPERPRQNDGEARTDALRRLAQMKRDES